MYLSKVDRLQRGLHTTKCRKAASVASDINPPELVRDVLTRDKVLSIIYEEDGTYDSLDMSITDPHDFDTVLGTLAELVQLHKDERDSSSRELQLLQYHWTEMGKSLEPEEDGYVNLSEFVQLTDHVGLLQSVGKPKVSSLFKARCDEIQGKSEHLTFVQTAKLMEKVRREQGIAVDDPLEMLWRQMVKNDPVSAVGLDENTSFASYELHAMNKDDSDLEESVSIVAFLSFLRTQQKEFNRTHPDATNLVNTLNRIHSPFNKTSNGRFQSRLPLSPSGKRTIAPDDRLTKSRFIEFLTSDFNDILAIESDLDMHRPLSHYFIATSHESFSDMSENASLSQWGKYSSSPKESPNLESIYSLLYRGVRCLEVKVWDGPDQTEPVVGSTFESSKLRLWDCLKAIAFFIGQNPQTFPIVLKIENHCSTKVQAIMAKQIRDALCVSGFLFEPTKDLKDQTFILPTPGEARGKVIILAKRSRGKVARRSPSEKGSLVIHDDYDIDNVSWELLESPNHVKYFDEEEESGEHEGVVIGFNKEGPIRSLDIHASAVADSPTILWEKAERERQGAKSAADQINKQFSNLEKQAEIKEHEALESPLSRRSNERESVKPKSSPRSSDFVEEKNAKDDEGVEIQDVLSDILEASNQEYVKAALDAMDGAKNVQHHKACLARAEKQLKNAKYNLDKSSDNVEKLSKEAQKAKLRAAAHQEHAHAARARLDQVRTLLKNSEETSSSAETVVVTALTEAKISEKRASDAEARAAKAQANASKDRAKSDKETKKEEELEKQVTALVTKCKEASRSMKEAKQVAERASTSLDRVNDQIVLVENSLHYKEEVRNGTVPSASPPKHGGTFVDKRAGKIAERDQLVSLIKQATAQQKKSEGDRKRYQAEFEELNQALRLQTELATKMRKVADRSAHVAEELAEHAEEEREAANLRHFARERAEENVNSRGNHKDSLHTQFQEAQRAASDAAALAEEAKKKAKQIEDDLETAKDTSRLSQIVEEREWACKEARSHYDIALEEKREKDSKMLRQKRVVDDSDEVRQATSKSKSVDLDHIQMKKSIHQDAIEKYTESVILGREAERLSDHRIQANAAAKEKAIIALRAREYKEKMDLVVELPHTLSSQTLLHSSRHLHWKKSLELSSAHSHSLSYYTLQKMIETEAHSQERRVRTFTQGHLCRIFPPIAEAASNKTCNYDPIFPMSLGCQLVSMNYNQADENLLVSEGFFRQNGSCGYVLKPAQLFEAQRTLDEQRWRVRILGVYHLPRIGTRRNHTTPIVRLTLHTGEEGKLPFTYETRPSRRKGTDPILFAEDNVCTLDVGNEWVATASFTVLDSSSEKRDFIAGAAVPVSCFKEGYRSIALFDPRHTRTGPYKFASILVHVAKTN